MVVTRTKVQCSALEGNLETLHSFFNITSEHELAVSGSVVDIQVAVQLCCSSAVNVGGRISKLLDFCVQSSFLGSLTSTMLLI